jgi:nitroimidazol reductase NimA-like FMN-containing flavoprotein (pyridoxamine 5'-phosphate oxidase superfamily)
MNSTNVPEYFNNASIRRVDLAWSDWPAVHAFLKDELVCRLAINDGEFSYIAALTFTFTGESFLLHSARAGKLASLLRENPNVTIEIDRPIALLKAPKGQNTSLEYYSVIARCVAAFKESTEDVIAHQNKALNKFRPENDYAPIENGAANQITAYHCRIVEMTAKKRILADGQYSPPGQPKAPYLRYPFPGPAAISGLAPDAFDPNKFERQVGNA